MKEKLDRFFRGRYGNDQLNRFFIIVSTILLIVSFIVLPILYIPGFMLLIYTYFRMLSKNWYRRQAENNVYMKYTYKIRQFFLTQKRDFIQRKTHHIYHCPSCKQKIRVPKGKGKIEIRCPKCGQTFIKRS